jgi:arylsulfatase A-like enzyme
MARLRLSLLLLALLLGGCASPQQRPDNLIFISLDTVRRDHLPTYGYTRDTAPNIDRLARTAVVFDNAYAQETNTNPSHASMFTGVYPHVHGSVDNRWVLAEGQVTLAQILQRSGFRTAAFVSGVVMNKELTGLDRGFEIYDDEFSTDRQDGRETTRRAVEWLEERGLEERLFLFLHLYDAHGPYRPNVDYEQIFVSEEPGPVLADIPGYQLTQDSRGETRRERNGYVDRYDCQIRYLDDLVSELLNAVDLSESLVVILSDHGETLAERYHKFDHGAQPFDEQIRIPLIIRSPDGDSRRVAAMVETVDLLPTLLELLGVELPADRPVQGASLAPLLHGEEVEGRPFVFSASRPNSYRHADRGYQLSPGRRIQTIRSRDWKLIRYPGLQTDPLELYDLRSDPGERQNVSLRYEQIARGFMDALLLWESLPTGQPGELPPIDEETYEKLRSLGYVQ